MAHIFTRLDYVRALEERCDPAARVSWLDELPAPTRRGIAAQFLIDPFDSSCKLPSLAALVGKGAFTQTEVLVDDKGANVKRFARTGRRAVRIVSRAPRILFERVPNSVWRDPEGVLRSMATPVVRHLAGAIADVLSDEPGATREVAAEPAASLGARAKIFQTPGCAGSGSSPSVSSNRYGSTSNHTIHRGVQRSRER